MKKEKKKSEAVDMTTGNPGKRILFFALPMLGIQGMVNPYGTNTVAAYTAASKIDQIAIQPLNSMGTALSTYVSQNFGKGDNQRIRTAALIVPVVCFIRGNWMNGKE